MQDHQNCWQGGCPQMLASAAAKFCSQQEWSELYQLSPENEISKHNQLQNAAPPFSFLILYQISLHHFKNRRTRIPAHCYIWWAPYLRSHFPLIRMRWYARYKIINPYLFLQRVRKKEESTCLAVRSSRHCSFKINRSSCTFFILDTNFIGFAYRQH